MCLPSEDQPGTIEPVLRRLRPKPVQQRADQRLLRGESSGTQQQGLYFGWPSRSSAKRQGRWRNAAFTARSVWRVEGAGRQERKAGHKQLGTSQHERTPLEYV